MRFIMRPTDIQPSSTAPAEIRSVKLSPHEIRKIAVLCFRDDRTVTRAYEGDRVQPIAYAAIVDAAERCGLPVPPPLARSRRAA